MTTPLPYDKLNINGHTYQVTDATIEHDTHGDTLIVDAYSLWDMHAERFTFPANAPVTR